jgi:hypothetical protein
MNRPRDSDPLHIVLRSYVEKFQLLVQPASWRTTRYRLSVTACSIYSQRLSISGGRLLHLQPEDLPSRGDLCPLHVAFMEAGRGAYRVLVGKPDGKRPLERFRRRLGIVFKRILNRLKGSKLQ